MKTRRVGIAAILVVSFLNQSTVQAYPGDVFASASPVQAPSSTSVAAGESEAGHSVSSDGAAEFSIPIPVAPNRQDMVPDLALSYSSRGAVRGGIAMGWSLNLPVVERDTSRGRLGHRDYRSSMSRGRLLRVGPEVGIQPGFLSMEEYRAQEDAAGTRYLRLFDETGTLGWQAYTTDGRTYHFGETAESKDYANAATIGIYVEEGRFHLTRIVDRFGNEIVFTYEKVYAQFKDKDLLDVPVDSALVKVEYGRNSIANLQHHARLVFGYQTPLDLCPGSQVPIGAQFDFRTGFPIYKGARRLQVIRLEVFDGTSWVQRRMLDLEYDSSELNCQLDGKLHAPLRVLDFVVESATAPDGTVTTLPAVTFEYGRRQRAFSEPVSFYGVDLGSGQQALSDDKGGGWPTVDAMLLDLDGDGLLDRLSSRRGQSGLDPMYCEGRWESNAGSGNVLPPEDSFGLTMPDGAAGQLYLPVIPWADGVREDDWSGGAQGQNEGIEDCSLSAQFSREANSNACGGFAANYLSYRFMDMTGDGLPDLVTGLDVQRGRYTPESDPRLWPDTASCPDPLACACTDEGACIDTDGSPGLCEIIDAPNGFFADPPPQCDSATCQHEQAHAVSNPSAEPIQRPGNGFYEYIGKKQGWWAEMTVAPEQERTGENEHPPWRGDAPCQMYPEIRCGHYVLRVYDNVGNGEFATTPRLLYAPIPIETDRPTSRLGAGHLAVSGSWHGIVDLDGDGNLDAVYKQPDWATSNEPVLEDFQVFRGDGIGGFEGDGRIWPTDAITAAPRIQVGGSRAIAWNGTPPSDMYARAIIPSITASFSSVSLEDMNGDGLADYVDARSSSTTPRGIRVLFNTGAGFEPVLPWYRGAHFRGNGPSPVEWFQEEQQWQDRVVGTGVTSRGFSRATWRTVDLDADGLLDIVRLPPLAPDTADDVRPYSEGTQWVPEVYFNVGDSFVLASNPPLDDIWQALARIRITDGGSFQGYWQLLTDFVDLDGDGLPEAVVNDQYGPQCRIVAGDWACSTGINNALTDPPDGQALRALKKIRNGRGAEIEFKYDSVRTPNGRVPHPIWAVTEMRVTPGVDGDGVEQPEMVTTYAYDHAEYNDGLDGQWGFRGFGVVEVTAPGGARTVTTSDFSQDYSGLVVEERVYDRPSDPTHAATITTKQYEERRIFPAAPPIGIISQHLVEEVTRICGAEQDETACASAGAIKRTSNVWETLTPAGGSTPLVHVSFSTETGPGFGVVEGTVYRNATRRLIDEPGKFWIVTDVDRERWWLGGQWHDGGNTHYGFDASNRVSIWTGVLLDTQWNWLMTSRTFDMATGNLTGEKQPRYYWSSGPWTTFEYDSTKTFVSRTTNPLGHVVDIVTDRATGVVTESRGPNTTMSERDGWRKTIDGLGRVKAEFVWVDDATTGYRVEQTARYAYSDWPSPRPSTTSELRHEAGGSMWTKSVVETDGLGREVKSSVYNNGSIQAVSRSYFDAAGNMVRTRVPDPNATNQAYVEWKYAYDALGRVTAAREPTRTGCSGEIGSTSWCGTRWSYDRFVLEEEDVVGTAGGQIGRTRTHHDVFGSLVAVDEMQTSGAWATTMYTLDGNGNVLSTSNADGVTTTNTYDYADRRRTSTRDDKTWVFGYDADSNLTSVQSPVPSDGLLENHITTFAYDALGRVTSEVAAERLWTETEAGWFGEPVVSRTYDVGANGIGRLSQVSQDTGTIDYAYDAQGRVIGETHAFSIWGDQFSDQRQVQRRYGLQGQLLSSTAADAATPSASTRFTYAYDQRLQPNTTYWYDGPTYKGVLETAAYNPSGRLYFRYHYDAGGAVTQSRKYWDPAGRVTTETVGSRLPGQSGVTTRAQQTYAFDGAGDVKNLTTVLRAGTSGPPHVASLGYDRMHRLVSATGPKGYTGSFGYSPGGRITAANVNAAAAAVRVHRRNVTYAYGAESGDPDADPDAPVRLDSAAGGTWMSIDYDTFGNTLRRSEGGTTLDHLYDGFDRQRMTASFVDTDMELYWYGPDGQRSIVMTSTQWGAEVERVRWIVGNTEIWYRDDGTIEKQVAHTAMGSATTRVEDHARREFLYNDARGHLLAVVGEDGALKAGFRHGPYGELLEQIGPEQADFLRRFNGKEFDAASGLTYYGYRYYDERTLTWTQADPWYRANVEKAGDEPRRASLYGFSLGNPVSMVDPDGRDSRGYVKAKPRNPDASKPAGNYKPTSTMSFIRQFWNRSIGDSDQCVLPADKRRASPDEHGKNRVYFLTAYGLDEEYGFFDRVWKREFMVGIEARLNELGYAVTFINRADTDDLEAALADPFAVGVFLDSHGGPNFGTPGNYDGIEAADIAEVGANLRFFVLMGCKTGPRVHEWADSLGVTTYGFHYNVDNFDTLRSNIVHDALSENIGGFETAQSDRSPGGPTRF